MREGRPGALPVSGELPRLTSLRAFAALGVFGYHLLAHGGWQPVEPVLAQGFAGVGFFFVLSGFVLAWSSRPGERAARTYRRRFARVWPSHAVMTVIVLLLPVTAVALEPARWTASLLLVQVWGPDSSWHYAGNGVSWSLACEAAFYLALPLILYALRGRTVGRRLLLAGGWYLLTAVATVLLVQQGPAFENAAYVNPVLRSGEFVLGVAAGLAVRDGWRPRLPLPAVLVGGLVALAACRLAIDSFAVVGPVLAPVWLAVTVCAAQRDLQSPGGWLAAPALVRLGTVSFAFYLVHEPVLLTVLWFRGSDLTGPDGAATALLVLLLSVAAAFLLHTAVEVPAQRRLAGRRAPSHAGTELPVQRVGPKPPTGVLLRSPADGAARPEDPPTVAGG